MTLTCINCGQQFDFTEGEQEFYQQMGFNQPKRCKTCRLEKKAKNNPSPPRSGHKIDLEREWKNKKRNYDDYPEY